ncbi:hypothetical protein [Proteiniborus sp. MB09-C3]|uniref:hypothetical protein n=1 Tax=Proteiniborus sp. MB09-C3 TaxID=3050072 RepID=UPI0025554336|nr:hypothetical protein [Proteiniborus sp. MB09-C3]WIV13427.1 hypothetical protein QO263_06895 [Proteiniborus sp. MB09-C3]
MRMFFVTLKEKRAILNSFNNIVEVKDDNDEFSYYLSGENTHKLIAKGFNEGGEGYIYNTSISNQHNSTDGWVDVKDYTANSLRDLLKDTVSSNLH